MPAPLAPPTPRNIPATNNGRTNFPPARCWIERIHPETGQHLGWAIVGSVCPREDSFRPGHFYDAAPVFALPDLWADPPEQPIAEHATPYQFHHHSDGTWVFIDEDHWRPWRKPCIASATPR